VNPSGRLCYTDIQPRQGHTEIHTVEFLRAHWRRQSINQGPPYRGNVPYCTSCATSPLSAYCIEEKWHNWVSAALFLYTTSAIWGSTPGRPQVVNWYSTALFLYTPGPHIDVGKEKPHLSTASGGSKPCVTETKKHSSPNTGARANNTLHVTRPPHERACYAECVQSAPLGTPRTAGRERVTK